MKNIKSYNDFNILNEGLSSILYHYTSLNGMLSILKENQFKLSVVIGSRAEIESNAGKFYFMSTQRTKGFSGYGNNLNNGVCIVLDGDKLKSRYKGFPIDYWKWSMARKDYQSDNEYRQALLSKELEDRIVSNKSTIPNASSYIKEVHFSVSTTEENRYEVKSIIELCQDKNIPLFIYNKNNPKDFKALNKLKAIDPDTIKISEVDDSYVSITTDTDKAEYVLKSLAAVTIVNDEKNKEILFSKIDSYFEDKEQAENIKKKISYVAKNFNYESYDFKRSSMSMLKNYKNDKNEMVVFIKTLIISDMKKYNMKSFEEYVDFKSDAKLTTDPKVKYEYSIHDKETGWNYKWDSIAWNIMSAEDFFFMLPQHKKDDLGIVELINDNKMTLKEWYKKSMKMLNKKFVINFLDKNNLELRKKKIE